MDVLHDGMLNARVLQFLDGLWSGISLSLVSTFVRFFVILYISIFSQSETQITHVCHVFFWIKANYRIFVEHLTYIICTN